MWHLFYFGSRIWMIDSGIQVLMYIETMNGNRPSGLIFGGFSAVDVLVVRALWFSLGACLVGPQTTSGLFFPHSWASASSCVMCAHGYVRASGRVGSPWVRVLSLLVLGGLGLEYWLVLALGLFWGSLGLGSVPRVYLRALLGWVVWGSVLCSFGAV